MKDIENVIVCGLGAIGSIYADKIHRYDSTKLKVLVDKNRLEKYTKNPKTFNGRPMTLDYILPENTDFKADLIIIATKFDGLNDVIKNIENFVHEDTVIISLLNGVTSEDIIAQKYGWKNLPIAYYIGHSAMRDGNKITHDGVNTIVFGVKNPENTAVSVIERVKKYDQKYSELIEEKSLLIDTDGYKLGEINGLTVMTIGDYSFGKPVKITANTFMGKTGVVNIEREVDMSGSTHSKGVLILRGYLGEKFAQNFPLSLTASL